MKKNNFILLSVMAAVTLFFAGTMLHAQEDKGVLLEFKPASSGSINYILTVDSDSMFTLYGLEKKIKQNVVTEFTMKNDPDAPPVKDAYAYAIEVLDEKITSDGEKVESPANASKLSLKLMKAGKILASSDPARLQYFQDLIISFPEKPVKAGEEWKVETPFKLQNSDGSERELTAILICRVEEFKKYDGKNCAVIATKLSVADEKTGTASLKAGASGIMHFDYETGMIAAISNTINMDVRVLDEKTPTKKPIEASTLKSKISVKLGLKK